MKDVFNYCMKCRDFFLSENIEFICESCSAQIDKEQKHIDGSRNQYFAKYGITEAKK